MTASAAYTAIASAARTTTGTSSAISLAPSTNQIALLVNVTAVAGTTPTLDLTVEWSNDGTTWAVADGTADSLAQITATKVVAKNFTRKAKQFRVRWTIAGTTPSFTFSIDLMELT